MPRPTLSGWLDGLRRDGVASIDPDVAIDAERLLRAWSAGGKPRVEEAADALAARIATSAEQYEVVRRNFLRSFGGPRAREPEVSAAWVVMGLGIALGVLIWVMGGLPEVSGPPPAEEVEVAVDEGKQPEPTPTPTTPTSQGRTPGPQVDLVEPRHETIERSPWPWWALVPSGIASLLLVALGLRLRDAGELAPEAARAASERAREATRQGIAARRAALAEGGPEEGEPYAFKAPAPMDVTAIDGAATILSRPGDEHLGPRLDVRRTVDHSARAGGRLVPRFARSNRQPPLLVLVDVEVLSRSRSGQAHPLAHAADWILDRWQRTGLHVARFDYAHRLDDELWEPVTDRRVRLEDLARRHGGARLLVWSRMHNPGGLVERARWLAKLQAWPQRAWIDLDPRPAEEGDDARERVELERMQELENAGLRRYPLTRHGLVAAASHVAGRGLPSHVRTEALDPVRLDDALAQWAAAACCVPDPTWMHLDALRHMIPGVRHVIPDATGVWRLLRWLEARRCLNRPASEATLRLGLTTNADLTLLHEGLSIEIDGRPQGTESWVRARLTEQLHDATPRSVVEAWHKKAKLAFHLCKDDPRRCVEELVGLLTTPAGGLAKDLLERVLPRIDERKLPQVKAAAEIALGVSAGDRVEARALVGRRPRWWQAGVATAVAVIVVGLAGWLGRGERVRVVPEEYAVKRPEPPEVVRVKTRPVVKLPETETVALELPVGARAMKLRRIEAGSFWMGSVEEEEGHEPDEQRHRVTITRGFMMCETEVTQAQWMAVMGANPSDCAYGCGDDVAVHNVSWEMAVEYLNAFSRKQGLEECYSKVGGDWQWERRCEGYRLPTEAEWEYAARAGTETAYSFADDVAKLDEHAWHGGNSGRAAHELAKKTANPWGLYDVHGNVWEWAWDWYERDYGAQARTDPVGPRIGSSRVLRGGSFEFSADNLRSAFRNWSSPYIDSWDNGLRCARGPYPSGRWLVDEITLPRSEGPARPSSAAMRTSVPRSTVVDIPDATPTSYTTPSSSSEFENLRSFARASRGVRWSALQ